MKKALILMGALVSAASMAAGHRFGAILEDFGRASKAMFAEDVAVQNLREDCTDRFGGTIDDTEVIDIQFQETAHPEFPQYVVTVRGICQR